MSAILTTSKINDTIASCLGVFANAILLWFMFTSKQVELKPVTKILTQNCIIDTLLAIVAFLSQPEIVVYKDCYYIVVGSFLNTYGFICASILIVSFTSMIALNVYAMPVPFYFRYHVICCKQKLTYVNFIKAYTVVFIAWIITSVCLFLTFPPKINYYEQFTKIYNDSFWSSDARLPSFVATYINNTQFIVTCCCCVIFMSISYSLVIFYSINISRTLKSKVTAMHVKTKQINHQVQRTLVVQAIAPFLACNLPVTILFLMIYLQSQNQYITIICSSILAWVPVVNPIAALMIIRFYRRKIFSYANKMFNMPPLPVELPPTTGGTPSTKP